MADQNAYQGVLIFAEQLDGKVSNVAYELIGKGRELAEDLDTEVTAIVMGHNIASLADDLAARGAQKVIVVDDPCLENYTTEPYTSTIYQAIEEFQPAIVLYGATAIGRDLAPRVSGRVHTGLTADCTKLEIDPDTKNLMMTRPAFGGNLMATILCPDFRPQMSTVRPGVMVKRPVDKTAKAQVINWKPDLTKNKKFVEVTEVIRKVSERMDIQDAKILVSGGRGIGSAEDFAILEALADKMGGVVAGSRAAVDSGWLEKDQQVGQTGKTVRPDLYFAIGISGAIQHLAGMEESDYIIAINKDATAPIFDIADVGIVGDWHTIVPALTEAIAAEQAAKAEG